MADSQNGNDELAAQSSQRSGCGSYQGDDASTTHSPAGMDGTGGLLELSYSPFSEPRDEQPPMSGEKRHNHDHQHDTRSKRPSGNQQTFFDDGGDGEDDDDDDDDELDAALEHRPVKWCGREPTPQPLQLRVMLLHVLSLAHTAADCVSHIWS
jgi:hypothetical protein